MLAWTVQQPAPLASHPLRLGELSDPQPGPGELLVRMRCCGICRTDLHVVEGDLAPRRSKVVPGHQVVGVVERVGEGTSGCAPGGSTNLPGDRVGIAWLHRTCGACADCRHGRENLCQAADFTGWTVDGGFAELLTVPAAFAYPIPSGIDDTLAAPLLCAGIIGYRALARTALGTAGHANWTGARLGLYGFGAAGHVAIQIARARGADVYVATRDRDRHQALAQELGAAWVGDTFAAPPAPLDAAIVFAPAGELVPVVLGHLAPGGVLVLGGIHMSDIPSFPYQRIWGEREIRSVANNTRADGRAFLAEAAAVGVTTRVQTFPFTAVDQALTALAHDAIRGAGVVMAPA